MILSDGGSMNGRAGEVVTLHKFQKTSRVLSNSYWAQHCTDVLLRYPYCNHLVSWQVHNRAERVCWKWIVTFCCLHASAHPFDGNLELQTYLQAASQLSNPETVGDHVMVNISGHLLSPVKTRSSFSIESVRIKALWILIGMRRQKKQQKDLWCGGQGRRTICWGASWWDIRACWQICKEFNWICQIQLNGLLQTCIASQERLTI